ncbi:MAG: glycosyltransferase [Candidatus Dependentiae bacterium]|nr:glycosyltransferase [Candidatus Dependentiae bacterium]
MKNYITCLVITVVIAGGAYYIGMRRSPVTAMSSNHCSLRTDMRKLWSDHAWWTRDYLITAIAGMPDVKAATDRLLKNQVDIGVAMVPFYGKEAGEKLTALLKKHILIAADVVTAAKDNNNAKFKEANTEWYVNADEISVFLSNANPHWPKDAVQKMLYKHLKLTTDEATARLKKDWIGDIEAFEKVFDEIMMMADTFTQGIVQQFPEKF